MRKKRKLSYRRPFKPSGFGVPRRFDIAKQNKHNWELSIETGADICRRRIRSVPEFEWVRRDNDLTLTPREDRMRHYIFWLLGWAEVPPVNIQNIPFQFNKFKYDCRRVTPESDTISIKELARRIGTHPNTLQQYLRGPYVGMLRGEKAIRVTDPLKAFSGLWLLLAPANLPPGVYENLRRVASLHLRGKVPIAEIYPVPGIMDWGSGALMDWVLYGVEPPHRGQSLAGYRQAELSTDPSPDELAPV